MDIVRQIKEKACHVSLNPRDEAKNISSNQFEYFLPDGNSVIVRKIRFFEVFPHLKP